jgi:hypothetical protein
MEYLKELLMLSEKQKKQLPPLKVGAKTVNDTLRSKKGGRHFSAKTDYKRADMKSELAKALTEAEDDGIKYFSYTVWFERKDYGNGDGGDRSDSGVTRGKNAAEVKARLSGLNKRTYSVELKEISKEAFDKAQGSDD